MTVSSCFALSLDCPFEWRAFDSSCYKIMTNFLFSTKLSWGNARSVCLGFGGDLVSITNKKEMDFVDEISSGIGSELIWIGLIDWLHDGEFAWSDGTLFNGSVYNNWAGRQPSGGEYCVSHSISERRWHDYPCSHTFDYICEKPRGRRSDHLFSVCLLFNFEFEENFAKWNDHNYSRWLQSK